MSRVVPVPNLAVNSMATAVNVSPSIGVGDRYQAACFPSCECIAKHRGRGQIPGCLFSEEGEKLHDRSLEAFLEDVKRRQQA